MRGVLHHDRGFSLIEVMVALVVVAIGLLGLAKMESLALSSTNVSGLRSIAAIEAESLAAQMHANRGYWASASVIPSLTMSVTNGNLSFSDATLYDPGFLSTGSCLGSFQSNAARSVCNPQQMAAFETTTWANNIFIGDYGNPALVPGGTATITCTPVTTLAPGTCTITISWLENAVAANKQQTGITQGDLTTFQNSSYTLKSNYTLYVQP